MFYIVVNVKDKEIYGFNDYTTFDNCLESLGSFPDCEYFHIKGLDENEYSKMLYTLLNSYHYQNFKS